MTGYFELKKGATERTFMFNLKAANHEVILTSQIYHAKISAEEGIVSVQENSTQDERFERKTSKSNEPYFVLKAANGLVIGSSEMYSSPSAMEAGIDSVKANGDSKSIKDLVVAAA